MAEMPKRSLIGLWLIPKPPKGWLFYLVLALRFRPAQGHGASFFGFPSRRKRLPGGKTAGNEKHSFSSVPAHMSPEPESSLFSDGTPISEKLHTAAFALFGVQARMAEMPKKVSSAFG
ncbi:MAG: hypothetical protein IJO10_06085 [Clostridia bacterium]|nr:hypothetical protein [Clostridia bacterium]